MSKEIVSQGMIESKILIIRGQRVMLDRDRDLAPLYGVAAKALNQAVKRKSEKFPADFMFQLNKRETEELSRSICDLEARSEYKVLAICIHRA